MDSLENQIFQWTTTYIPHLLHSRNSNTPKPFYLHPCLRTEETETEFIREMVEVMLKVLLPENVARCETARHLLREIVTCTGRLYCDFSVFLKVDGAWSDAHGVVAWERRQVRDGSPFAERDCLMHG